MGDAATAMGYLYCRCREPRIHFLAGAPVRRRVILAGNLDAVVDADADDPPFGELIAVCWQGFKYRAAEFGGRAVAATRQFLEWSRVQDDSFGYVQS